MVEGTRVYSRAEVAKHDKYDDAWIIIDNGVYDISKWIDAHPGGKVLLYYRGQDATEPVYAFHPDMEKTRQYMKTTYIGELESPEVKPIVADFRKLREELRTEGYFKPRYHFYILHLLSVFLFEYIAYLAIANLQYGSMIVAAIFLAVAQVQAGWLQHDLGHCAVFKSAFWNQAAHYFLISHLKGASSWWWKSKHNRHHAKTNIVTRDPDMHIEPFFSFSEIMAKTRFSKYIPILEHQHRYWFLMGPPMVTTFLFVIQNMVYMAEFGQWVDMAATLTFFVKFELIFHNYLTTGQLIGLYFMMRFIESHWFTWVTSMNHLPRPILEDSEIDWLKLQVDATQNIEGSFFNNWFTGHLNYQVEHHLFPTMPRHRYPEVADRVRALCERNGLKYRVRSLWQSCVDIVDQLGVIAVIYKEEKAKRQAARAAKRAAGASSPAPIAADKPAVAIKQE